MKHFYIAISFFLGILPFSAQETKTLWQKDIQSSTQDFLTTMTSTIDRQILLSGSSINTKSRQLSTDSQQTNKDYDYHVLKLDQQGSKVWEKYFGGTRHDYLMSSVSTQEGGFLLAGTSFSNQSGDKKENNLGGSDVWLVKLNENGDEEWQKTIGTKSNDEASSVVQAVDEGFFVAGDINNNKNLFGSADVFVSKLDKAGNLIHTIILGGNGMDEVQEMIATPDGGSLILIYSNSGKTENTFFQLGSESGRNSANPSQIANTGGKSASEKENYAADLFSSLKFESGSESQSQAQLIGKTEDHFGEGDCWIVKLDKDAQVEWQKTYGGSGDDHPKTIAFTDKGYLIGGESRSNSSGNKKENIQEGTDLWLISLDKEGNEIWQKSYNFGNRDVLMSMDVIRKTNKENYSEDKGFLLGGYTQAEEKVKPDDEKFWMLYIDPSGKEEWRKYVEGKSKKKEERLVSAKLQNDGTFLLAGTSADRLGDENWKIVKLGDKDLDQLIEKQDIRIYPNPVDDYCYVEIGQSMFNDSKNEEAEIFLHDMSGRQIQSIKTKNQITKINTAALPQGVYIVTASVESKNANAKIVKK